MLQRNRFKINGVRFQKNSQKFENSRPQNNLLADLGLPMQQLDEILQAGNFDDEFNFDFFTGVACLNLGGSVSTLLIVILKLTLFQQIFEALRLLCQLLTEDLSGYAERVSFDR